MIPRPGIPCFTVEQVGAVTVVRFAQRSILEDELIAQIREHLFDLVDREGRRLFVLNFGRVTGLASRMLGQLVALHQKLQEVGGRVVLCEVSPFLSEFFDTAQLPGLLSIRGGEAEALQALTAPA
jgi:anti-anti-sigma factor